MERATALEQAIYLLLMPAAVRQFRQAPLPEDVRLLLRILADDGEAQATAVEICGKPAATIVSAAEFYTKEILFAPGATAYRALGCEPRATRDDLRANMILLMRWLHPDTANGPRDGDLFEKVRRAWQIMRSDEGRAAYDQGLASSFVARGRPGGALALSQRTPAPRPGVNPFLDRAPGSRRRRLMRQSIYVIAVMLVLLLVAFALEHFGALDDVEVGADGRWPRACGAVGCEVASLAASSAVARLGRS